MKKNLFFVALAALALASCSDDTFVGENSPNLGSTNGDGGIHFGFDMQNATRADIYGNAAATLLGNNFYVVGTKGSESATYPTDNVVFNNYVVNYGVNTAGTTASNTANWEYVGENPLTGYSKLSPAAVAAQTIKYWDYSAAQYDFFAFSTGTQKAIKDKTTPEDTETGVTSMVYGSALAGNTAYTLWIPTVAALEKTYFTDIQEVRKNVEGYGKEVQLKFKNLGSKVRIALYETIPGYAVKDVIFYALDGTNNFTDANKNTIAKLISADANGFPTKARIDVSFPYIGNNNQDAAAYNKANATVTPVTASSSKTQAFSTLNNYAATKEGTEANGNYLGRTLPTATFAGSPAASYYQTVFPVSSSSPITLRVDYTLVSTDGSGEEINVYGAKAVVPSKFTEWKPNYAYTYIFKISDNTNGWTDEAATAEGLFPITFDAVVAEATDATAEQATVTTVATPSITTYQQNHNPNKDGKWITTDEYSKATGKNIYVQVMDNSTVPASLVSTLSNTNSLLYEVTGANISEATVMDALENRTSEIATDDVTGRNGISLAKNSNITMTGVTSIENGVDDKPITITAGQASKITIGSLSAGTYAYVYDYTAAAKNVKTIYQPIEITGTLASGTKYVTLATLNGLSTTTTGGEAVDYNNYLYFSKTTNGTGTTTYSYVSVDGKATLPAGLLKCPVGSLSTSAGDVDASAAAFVFDVYKRNDGKYAVKIIKIVA